MRLIISLALCAVLAACGGGGSQTPLPAPPAGGEPDAPSFTAQQAQEALQAVIPDGVSSTWAGVSVDALDGEEQPLTLTMPWPVSIRPVYQDGRWRVNAQAPLELNGFPFGGNPGGEPVIYTFSPAGAVGFTYKSRESTLAYLYQGRFWTTQEQWEGTFNGGVLAGSYHTRWRSTDLKLTREVARHTFTLTRR
jgi:hypothetical protein